MDERALKELEIAGVAGLYGLVEAPAAPRIAAPRSARGGVEALGLGFARKRRGACTACGLCKQRKQAVFGVGSRTAPWLVGDGPGADEDEQGDPFVGQAGKLLDNMFAAVGIRRGREVYIANVVKCRPPGNRTPTAEEAAACAPSRPADRPRPTEAHRGARQERGDAPSAPRRASPGLRGRVHD